jgi:hypothetical protein
VKPSLKKAFKALPPEVQKAFREFGRIGGKKGGKARAQRMTAEQRREAARKAVEARWKRYRESKKK